MTIISAYSAVFLIKVRKDLFFDFRRLTNMQLLRRTAMLHELAHTASNDIHELISQTADAYQEAALLAVSSSSAAYHARFLRALVAKDAESQVARRANRTSMSSSRASPDNMDEVPQAPPRRSSNAVPSYAPMHPGQAQPVHGSHSASPQYPSFPGPAHAAIPPAIHTQTPQMSPTETKPPVVYRTSGSGHSSNPPSAGGYAHYNDNGAEYGRQPGVVVQYPAVIPNSASELDMRYSRSLLQELGYAPMPVEPLTEWFTQAMGPSSCAGLL
jgi:hypothetical protein